MRKSKMFLSLLVLSIIFFTPNVYAAVEFCAKTSSIWQIVGYVFFILKIIVPIILIVTGLIDLFKATVDGESVSKLIKTFATRAIAAVLIFFVPTIVGVVMGLVSNFSESGAKEDYQICVGCLVNPSGCNTATDVGKR